jgi:hypothetical protein
MIARGPAPGNEPESSRSFSACIDASACGVAGCLLQPSNFAAYCAALALPAPAANALLSRDDRQNEARRMLRIMINSVRGHYACGFFV